MQPTMQPKTSLFLAFICHILATVRSGQSCADQFRCFCRVSESDITCDYTNGTTFDITFAQINETRVLHSFYMMHSIGITQLGPYFAKYVSFEMINIRDVKSLTAIDENALWSSEQTLEMLRIISTSVNTSDSLFRAISKLVRLSDLDLEDNQIEVIPDFAFSANQTRLIQVTIARNRIKYLGQFAFLPLISLDYIDLSENLLENIQNNSFVMRNNTLKRYNPVKINIRLNRIVSISEEAFAGLMRPVNLDISFNNLTILDCNTYRNMLQYDNTKITIRGNKVHCDCDLKWLFDGDSQFKAKVSGPLRCADKRYFNELDRSVFANCTAHM